MASTPNVRFGGWPLKLQPSPPSTPGSIRGTRSRNSAGTRSKTQGGSLMWQSAEITRVIWPFLPSARHERVSARGECLRGSRRNGRRVKCRKPRKPGGATGRCHPVGVGSAGYAEIAQHESNPTAAHVGLAQAAQQFDQGTDIAWTVSVVRRHVDV